MDRIKAAEIFIRVVELSSFTATAKEMGLPKASVSAAIRQLEENLGITLLHRTTRCMHITHDGQMAYDRCKELLASLEEIHELFRRDSRELSGRVRVDMAQGVARNVVVPRLPEFLEAHPKLQVQLSGSDNRANLIQDGFDCVLRVGELRDSRLFARRLGHFRLLNCASPGYLARYGTPRTLADLAQHQKLSFVPDFGSPPQGFVYPVGNGYESMPMNGSLTVNTTEVFEGACVAGTGIIQAPQATVQRYLDSGQLVSFMPDMQAPPVPVTLLYANRRYLPQRTLVLMDWLEQILQPYLVDAPTSDHSPPIAPDDDTNATGVGGVQ